MIHFVISNFFERMFKYILIFVLFIFGQQQSVAQNRTITALVIDNTTNEHLSGVRVKLKDTKYGAVSDSEGSVLLKNIPPGLYELRATLIGYELFSEKIQFPGSDTFSLTIHLVPFSSEGEEVVVTGTRSERSIADVPVRVEAVPQEEVEEKLLMRPSSVAMLLNESPGIRVQNTSATSNTANLRIQGLDGRYTQILVDGIPNFSGLAAGFGITQLIPLNLRQVEIVKGANSALYGADAISGVVNFITKEPRETPEISGVLNVTNQKGYDASAYYGQQFEDFGLTTLVSYNHQERFDVNGDHFSDLAGYTRITIAPKFEYQIMDDLKATLNIGYFNENRVGGVMDAPESGIGKAAPYLESNKTDRYNGSLALQWNIDNDQTASVRSAVTSLDRNSYYGATPFTAKQTMLFADGVYGFKAGIHDLQVGAAFNSEDFSDKTPALITSRSYRYNDIGAWLQDEMMFSQSWRLLASARVDQHNIYGTFVTPRASLLWKESPMLSFRVGVGSGFKAPTIFLEGAEMLGFRNVRPITNATAEQAQSATFDINYKAIIGPVAAQFNLAFYTTRLEHALVIDQDSLVNDVIHIRNASGLTLTRGGEFTGRFSLEDFKLSLSYAYLDTRQTDGKRTYELELNPHHWVGIVLMYENEENGIKAGLENYFTSLQHIYDSPFRTTTPPYWITGILVEKAFGNFRLFVNAENIFDTRQTRFDPTFTGNPETGDFHPLQVYAPLEGRAINAGVRFVF